MQEFSVFAIVFAILAISGGFGEIPEQTAQPDDRPLLLSQLKMH